MTNKDSLDLLRNKGYKITKTRKATIDIINNSDTPISADKILQTLHSVNIKANKTTVYRSLSMFAKENLVKKIFIDPQKILYESADLVHHHHLVCNTCNEITPLQECPAEDIKDQIEKNLGFAVTRHTLEFYGFCINCRQYA